MSTTTTKTKFLCLVSLPRGRPAQALVSGGNAGTVRSLDRLDEEVREGAHPWRAAEAAGGVAPSSGAATVHRWSLHRGQGSHGAATPSSRRARSRVRSRSSRRCPISSGPQLQRRDPGAGVLRPWPIRNPATALPDALLPPRVRAPGFGTVAPFRRASPGALRGRRPDRAAPRGAVVAATGAAGRQERMALPGGHQRGARCAPAREDAPTPPSTTPSKWPLTPATDEAVYLEHEVKDDQLRMLFVCADPGIPRESQIVFALKILCGFSVEEIALRLFQSHEAIYKRLQRARAALRERIARARIASASRSSRVAFLRSSRSSTCSSPKATARRNQTR